MNDIRIGDTLSMHSCTTAVVNGAVHSADIVRSCATDESHVRKDLLVHTRASAVGRVIQTVCESISYRCSSLSLTRLLYDIILTVEWDRRGVVSTNSPAGACLPRSKPHAPCYAGSIASSLRFAIEGSSYHTDFIHRHDRSWHFYVSNAGPSASVLLVTEEKLLIRSDQSIMLVCCVSRFTADTH